MTKLMVNLKREHDDSYPIYIDAGALDKLDSIIKQHYQGTQLVIITDKTVAKLYTKSLTKQLIKLGYNVLMLEIKAGENSKSAKVKNKLDLQMLEHKINRHALVLAVGGGVVGDLTGFIAATYMRGIKYIQIPTTLLAMIDSSVGGKTAINTKFGKNLIGAFHQPKAVIMDLNLLDSLPKKHITNGLIEVIKIFLTSSLNDFKFIETNLDKILILDKSILQSIVQKAVSFKASVIEQDEREENLRMILNFGHTIGHAIEKVTQYTLLHGYAVALGILVEAQLALSLGKLSQVGFNRINKLITRLKVSPQLLNKLSADDIAAATLGDKKNRDGAIYCVLLKKIGAVALDKGKVATKVTYADIIRAFKTIQSKIPIL